MKKILFVEDDEFLGTIYSDILKSIKDVSVLLVNNGQIAFDEMLVHDWDLIILDALLPKIHAIDILKKLKELKPEKLKQNIIILTNLEESPMLEELKTFKYDIYFKSKLNPDEFISKIKLMLKE